MCSASTMHVQVFVLCICVCVRDLVGTRVILVENAPTCFRRVLAGQRALRSFVRRVAACEQLEDCRRECATEQRFHCESFNYRLDTSRLGKGLCELMTKPIEAFDLHRDFVQDKDYDFYEVDRNSLEPDCPNSLRGPGLLHSGFLSSKDRSDRPSLPDRPGGNRLDGWRDRNDWGGTQEDRRYNKGGNRRNGDRYVPYQIGQARTDEQENWGQYGGVYGGSQYYKNRNDYHKSINHWGLTSERPTYGVKPYHGYREEQKSIDRSGNDYEYHLDSDYHGKGPFNNNHGHKDYSLANEDFDYHSLGKEDRTYHSSGEDYYGVGKTQHRYGYGAWKRGRWNTSGVSNGLDLEEDLGKTFHESEDRSDEVSTKDCFSRRRPGMSLNTGAIRRSLIARNVVACEAACFGEKEFKCVSYSYRYSNSREADNCFLSERSFHGLDLSADSGSDVYAMPQEQGCSAVTQTPWIQSECFYHVRSDTAVGGAAVKSSLTVAGLGACEAECIRAQGFFCRGFSFRFDSPTIGEELHNCILTSSPTTSLSGGGVRRAAGYELYARGNYGRGCEPAHDVKDNGECYLQYDKAAKLTPSATRGKARVKDEQSCSNVCTEAPFRCLSFSYNNNAPPEADNCLLSEIRLFDLQREVDYVHSVDDWLFAFDMFNSRCWLRVHSDDHSSEIPRPISHHSSSEEDTFPGSAPSGPGYGPSEPSGPSGPSGPPSGPPDSYITSSGPPGYPSYPEYKPYPPPSGPERPHPNEPSGYKPEPGYAKEPSYPSEPGYKPGYRPEQGPSYPSESLNPSYGPPESNKPSYGPDPEYSKPSYGPDPEYSKPGYRPDSGHSKPSYGPDPEYSKPVYRPDSGHSKPSYGPDHEYSKPGYRPDSGYSKPGYGPDPEYSKPSYRPDPEYSKPSYRPDPDYNKPSYGSVPEYSKPSYKPDSEYSKPGYRPDELPFRPEGPPFRPPDREGYKPFRPAPRPELPGSYRPAEPPGSFKPGFQPPQPYPKPVDTGFKPGYRPGATGPGYGRPQIYPPEDRRPGVSPQRPVPQGDREGGPLEVPWREYTVSGFPCRAGTRCAQNHIVGHWACEPEGGEVGSWDYCCAPSHRCGYSEGFHKPWCYVGPKEDQWRPCSEKYYPYHQHNAPHPSQGSQGHREDLHRPSTRPWPPKPNYIPQWDKPPGPYLSPSDKQYWDSLYENGPRAYYDKYGNPLPGYSRVPTESRPHIRTRYNPGRPAAGPGAGPGSWVPVEDPAGVPGGLGAPRYWPVAYLHRERPPNTTYFRYNETRTTTTTEKYDRTTTPPPSSRELPPEGKTSETPIDLEAKSSRDDKKINISKTDEVFQIDVENDTTTTTTTEAVVVEKKVNVSEVDAMKTENYKDIDRIDGIDDKLDDFSKSIEVLDIEDAKSDKLSDLKTLEAEERQIEAIGRLLASRRGTKLVIEKRSQKDLETKNIAIDKDLVDFNFGNRFPTSERRAERRGVIKRISKDEIERDRNVDRSLEVSETTFVRPPRVLSTTENIRKAIVNGRVFYDATIREQRDLFTNVSRKLKNSEQDSVTLIPNNTFREQRDIYLNSTRKPKHLQRPDELTTVNLKEFTQNSTSRQSKSLKLLEDQTSISNTKNLREERDTIHNNTRKAKTRRVDDSFTINISNTNNSSRKAKNQRRLEENSTPSVISNNNFGKRKVLIPRNVNPVRRVRRVYRKRYNPEEVRKRLLERDRNKNSTLKI